QKTVTDARDFLGSDRMVIYQFNSDWSGAIVAESVEAGLPSAFLEQLSDPCIPASSREKYLADRILQENDVVEADFHPEHLALLQNLKVRSILGVPIVNQGKLFGLLIAHYCHSIHTWQSSEVDFMKQIGLQLGMVIERVQLLEQTQDLAEEQRQLKEALQRSALQLLIDVDPVSQGDLTVRAKVTEDEIGTVADSYNATIASLRKIVRQVQDAAEQVAETTSTNESAVRTLTTSASEQAKEILAALERVEEMASSVRLVAISAEKAEAAVQEAAQTVQEGDEAMNRTVDGILAIRETVAETAKKVKRLGESSQKISNVVNLISGFAAQTNMLALNASIEASRAGEDGKGFAVVAEEVRSLARQSAEATTEIEKLVASIQAETNEVVRAMEAGTEQVVTGTRLVDDTRQSLNKITSASRQISTLVESIAEATVTQSQASETVTATITTVAQIADQNSTAAGQVSESFEQLRSVAQALQAEVGRFKIR
ncbi:methyl-accepting chemotaxis protein, partial [Leptolyngbya sp. FACHB-711]